MEGFGEFNYSDGQKYKGYYRKGLKEGFGVYSIQNKNKIFTGFWSNGKQNGVGCIISKNIIKYGLWQNGSKIKWFKNKFEMLNSMDKEQKKFLNLFKDSPKEHIKFLEE